MSLCREWTILKGVGPRMYAEPLRCKRWSCDHCRPFRANMLKALARDGSPDTFLTLTVNPATGTDPDDRARALSRALRLLRLRAMRKYHLKSLAFLAVFERTKKGEAHLHVLMRSKWLDQAWIAAVMKKLIGAPIVNIQRVTTPKGAARYIAKYIGKDPQGFLGTRRYWRSRDWVNVSEADRNSLYVPPDWVSIIKQGIQTVLNNHRRVGWHISQEEGGPYCISQLDTEPMWRDFFRGRSYLAHPQATP